MSLFGWMVLTEVRPVSLLPEGSRNDRSTVSGTRLLQTAHSEVKSSHGCFPCLSLLCRELLHELQQLKHWPGYSRSCVYGVKGSFSLSQENIEDVKLRAPSLKKISHWPFWHSRKKAEIYSDDLCLKSELNNHLCMCECARDFAVSADECRIYILKSA